MSVAASDSLLLRRGNQKESAGELTLNGLQFNGALSTSHTGISSNRPDIVSAYVELTLLLLHLLK
jgi:hypothetical protein